MRLAFGDSVCDVRVLSLRDGVEVLLDGRSHRLDVRRLSPTCFELVRDGRREVFHCVREGETVHLHWRGWPYELHVEKEGARAAQRHASGALEAPMPGKVIEVSVAVGQEVEKGDRVLVVEAMKMENQLRAPRAGRVKAIAVKVGDLVSPGVVLAEIE